MSLRLVDVDCQLDTSKIHITRETPNYKEVSKQRIPPPKARALSYQKISCIMFGYTYEQHNKDFISAIIELKKHP